ncbi:MAG TPA: HAD family hydrolase [Xenococcaceae cyanobacterium]
MLSAILFDLDGTLANTDPIHFAVWQDILSQYNLAINRDFYQKHISGKTNAQITSDILPRLSPEAAWQLAIDKEVRYRQLAKILQPMPGLKKILKLIDTALLKKAVVTNAPEENAIHMLETLQLTDIFPVVIMAKDAPPGKPDPAPYKLALSRLGIDHDKAIAFEDSPSGITSAVAAGIYTIAIASTHEPDRLLAVGASMVIRDFNSQELWQFLDNIKI